MNGDLLREAMRRAAAGEPSARDAFVRFQKVKRRAGMLRSMMLLGTVGVAAGVLVSVLPSNLKTNPNDSFIATTPGTMQTYTDPQAGFTLDYPSDWSVRSRAGAYADFFPTGTVAADQPLTETTKTSDTMNEYPHTFFVEITEHYTPPPDCPTPKPGEPYLECPPFSIYPLGGELLDADLAQKAGATYTQKDEPFDGQMTTRVDLVYPEAPDPSVDTPSYWCSSCHIVSRLLIDWTARWGIRVRIVAPTTESYSKYEQVADALVASIHHTG